MPEPFDSGDAQEDQQSSQRDTSTDNTVKDPEQWRTGDEPMTGAQASYLETLATQAGEDPKEVVTDDLTKAEASEEIDELRQETGREGS